MSKDLHVYTYGLDPFVFSIGDVAVHVHQGMPSHATFQLAPLDPPYAALTVPRDPAQFRIAIDERAAGDQEVRLILDRSGPTTEPAQLDATLIGLYDARAEHVSLHLVENAEHVGG